MKQLATEAQHGRQLGWASPHVRHAISLKASKSIFFRQDRAREAVSPE
jgi:hypothetical protein